MTTQEWWIIAAELQARWPHARIEDETLHLWFTDLADLDAQTVRAGMLAHYRDGDRFPPNGAQIRAKAVALRSPALDHGAAYALAMKAASSIGYQGGLAWLTEQSPAAAEAARRYGWREFCLQPADDTTRRAQFRDTFNNVAEAEKQERAYAGLPGVERKQLGPRSMAAVVGELAP